MPRIRLPLLVLVVLAVLSASGCQTAGQSVSDQPDTPFKLATFEAEGQTRVGVVLGDRVLDIAGASDHLVSQAQVSAMALPGDMRSLIEDYETVKPRLYQIANYFGSRSGESYPFAYDVSAVSILAPIKYPWNLLAAAANYRAHAEGMGAVDAGNEEQAEQGQSGGARGGFDASAASRIVPDRDAPVMFAKSPRSCIIDPGAPYYIPPGRDRLDWEGEMAIIIGKPAYLVSKENAHDYVFGYSIMYDVSDRGGRTREVSMFPGPNWFDGKSIDRGAPFGPYIVPKEFLPNHANLRVVTKVNGVVKQDQTTADLIWNEENLISFTTSVLTLYPGDVISTGTPSGTGAERGEFLKPGDVVTIEVEDIGTLTTPFEAYTESD
jgi:2,4-diketo-3-deoxy-L-fuconate hydrolase